MSMIRKTITITEQMDAWVKDLIKAGKYGNDSEYFRDLIRNDQNKEDGLDALRALLVEGEVSGVSDNTITEIWDEAEQWYQSKNA
jgi:antitoxin ParD1/3/4